VSLIRIVRHGETNFNHQGRFLGVTDVGLNERGHAQAVALRPEIKALRPQAVVTSPTQRASETAHLATDGAPPPHVDDRLREVDWGPWEGLTMEEIKSRHPNDARRYLAGEVVTFPGGESAADVARRFIAALSDCVQERTLFVTHSTCARVALAALFGFDPSTYRRHLGALEPTAWIEIEWGPEREISLLSYNRVPTGSD
jgi:broad specificity phosphatase PhoE